MESVFFYNEKTIKDVKKILKEDEFMRISYIERDSDALHSEKKGNFLFIQANDDEIKNLEEKFKDLEVERLTGEEEKIIIEAIKREEDSAATGMGMIFG